MRRSTTPSRTMLGEVVRHDDPEGLEEGQGGKKDKWGALDL